MSLSGHAAFVHYQIIRPKRQSINWDLQSRGHQEHISYHNFISADLLVLPVSHHIKGVISLRNFAELLELPLFLVIIGRGNYRTDSNCC